MQNGIFKNAKDDLPHPLPLMTKVSEADPPALNPSSHLLHVGKACQEVQLLLRLGLCQETILKVNMDHSRILIEVIRTYHLFLTISKSLKPSESSHLRSEEEAAKVTILDPAQGTGWTGIGGRLLRPGVRAGFSCR